MAQIRCAHVSDWHTTSDGAETILSDIFHRTRIYDPNNVEMLFVTGDMLVNTVAWRVRDYENEAAIQRKHWERMVESFREYYPHASIVAVRGNHDYCDYAIDGYVQAFDDLGVQKAKVNGIVVCGFRGVTAHHGAWADEYNDRSLDILTSKLPKKANVLLTHCPPFGVLDNVNEGGEFKPNPGYPAIKIPARRIGIRGLNERAQGIVGLKAHCFGHVHEQGGKSYTNRDVRYSNAALDVNEFYIEV